MIHKAAARPLNLCAWVVLLLRTCLAPLLAFVLLVLPAVAAELPGQATDKSVDTFQAGLSARLQLTLPDGSTIERPAAGEPFRLAVSLFDEAAVKPAAGLHPAAWLRPVEATNLTCNDAALAYRATGRLPFGAVDLNGILAGILHDDATFSFVDPRLDLSTSNILEITRLDAMPTKVAPDPEGRRIVLADPGGETIVLSPGSDLRRAAAPAGTRFIASGAGGFWAATARTLTLVDSAGPPVSVTLPGRPLSLVPLARADASIEDRVGPGAILSDALLLLESGRAFLVDDEGHTRLFNGPREATDVAYSSTAQSVLFVDGRSEIQFAWSDRIEPSIAPLPAPADHVAVSPDGRLALAWSQTATAVSVIDVATEAVIHAVSFDRPIREVVFAGASAFLLLDDLSAVMAMDLASAVPGAEPAVRQVRLGPGAQAPADAGPFLASLAPSPQVLALHRPSATVFVVMETGTAGMGPMSAFRVKGTTPRGLHILDRSLRETVAGRYETFAIAPRGGAWELVLTTGIGGLSACFPVPVEGPTDAANATFAIRLDPVELADEQSRASLRIRLVAGEGPPLSYPDRLSFVVMALASGWRETVLAERTADGSFAADIRLPGPGLYPVIPGFLVSERVQITPGMLEVR